MCCLKVEEGHNILKIENVRVADQYDREQNIRKKFDVKNNTTMGVARG